MKKVAVAAIQMACSPSREENLDRAEKLARQAAAQGGQIILLPELFEGPYFCQERNYRSYDLALPAEENPAVKRMMSLTRELGVTIPVSFYERQGNQLFNSVAMVDHGTLLGIYRKTHIPDDHYYQEKFYFSPGNTGFQVWQTPFGRVGVGICWDQWFPETARCLALMGAEILLFPTAIGSEPILQRDSMPHWRRVMQGHAAANILPVVAANRVGLEEIFPTADNGGQASQLLFYGSSFITDPTGEVIAAASRDQEEILLATLDLDAAVRLRLDWGLYRDRRPHCYRPITAG